MKTAVLMDGNNLAFRAMATLQLSNPDGDNVSAVWGSLNIIRTTLDKLDPDNFFVAWDLKGSTYRYALYPDYKGHRARNAEEEAEGKAIREDFYRQIDVLWENLPKFGVRQVRAEGIEADDLIAKWVQMEKHKYDRVIVVTSDKDMWQLIDEKVMCFNPVKGVYTHDENFEEAVGVRLDQYVDYKRLMGDSSDNIPGIRGCGEVTTVKLLKTYDSLDNIFADTRQGAEYREALEKSAVGARLVASKHIVDLNRRLMDLSISINAIPGMEDILQESLSRMVDYSPKACRKFCIENAFLHFLEKTEWWTPFHRLANKT